MAKYRVLQGKTSEGRDAYGKPLVYLKGTVFESDKDMLVHNAPGHKPKFERVDDGTPVDEPVVLTGGKSPAAPAQPNPPKPTPASPSTPPKPAPSTPTPPKNTVDHGATLESMDVRELKAFAEAEEIDLKGASTKADMLRVLKAAVK